MRKKLGSLLRNLALVAASFAVAGLLFECGVRVLAPQSASPYRFSPDTYFEPIPGARFVHRGKEFAVPAQFNEFGMRDVPRRLEKPAGSLRVALLGDSFAEALQVPLDSTLARRLESELQHRYPERRPEVLNFGVSGFGTVASLARYCALASRFNPDVVIYLFVHNDAWDVLEIDARLYEEDDGRMVLHRIELGPGRRVARTVQDFVKHHSHAYRFMRYRLLVRELGQARVEAESRAAAAGTAELLPGDEAWMRVRQALELLRDSTAADAARLLVVQATTRGPDMDARLAGICADLHIPFHTLVAALAADPGPVAFEVDGHWRARGHGIAGREIAIVVDRLLAAPSEPIHVR